MKLKVRSRNYTCKELKNIDTGNKKIVLRLGSVTETSKIFKNPNNVIEINSVEGCKNSSDKRIMKRLFVNNNITTPIPYLILQDYNSVEEIKNKFIEEFVDENESILKCNVIIKKYNSSKGNRIYLIRTIEEWETFINTHSNNFYEYIVERWFNFSKEYRIHIFKDKYVYSCRKMIKRDTPEEQRWHRHDINSVWIVENNPLFDKPKNWDIIIEECKNSLKALKLDIGAIDVIVQSNKKKNPKFYILETNSAPSLGKVGLEHYTNYLKEFINNVH